MRVIYLVEEEILAVDLMWHPPRDHLKMVSVTFFDITPFHSVHRDNQNAKHLGTQPPMEIEILLQKRTATLPTN